MNELFCHHDEVSDADQKLTDAAKHTQLVRATQRCSQEARNSGPAERPRHAARIAVDQIVELRQTLLHDCRLQHAHLHNMTILCAEFLYLGIPTRRSTCADRCVFPTNVHQAGSGTTVHVVACTCSLHVEISTCR
jgi:hypothetical protein